MMRKTKAIVTELCSGAKNGTPLSLVFSKVVTINDILLQIERKFIANASQFVIIYYKWRRNCIVDTF